MTALTWDQTGERLFETGVDHGVLYLPDEAGEYSTGYAWNGLTTVTESPSGAEASAQYADNIKYLNLISAEEFGGTIEAFMYPPEFGQCDGTASPSAGIFVGQQSRKSFGMSYRTLLGNDLTGTDHGFKLHLVYGATASPSEKAYATVNDSPEALSFSWDFSTSPVEVPGLKPTATLTLDSTIVDKDALNTLMEFLYGTAGADPRLPKPAEVISMFAGTIIEVTPLEPSYDTGTQTITIPSIAGVVYKNGESGLTIAAGPLKITKDTLIRAVPAPGYKFPQLVDTDWLIEVY